MKEVKLNTGFLEVFEQKLKKLIKKIDEELKKPKKERNKTFLKNTIKEAKTLKSLVKECRKQKGEGCCPNCGHSIV
jgi:sugar-specific transcriptional regulator TrmB